VPEYQFKRTTRTTSADGKIVEVVEELSGPEAERAVKVAERPTQDFWREVDQAHREIDGLFARLWASQDRLFRKLFRPVAVPEHEG
jgi:hypothetical protein